MSDALILIAGGTGDLGSRVAKATLELGASVRVLTRSSGEAKGDPLRRLGAEVVGLDYHDRRSLTEACSGAACVVSTLSGLRETIVDAQTNLLHAAIDAGVSRFIPSDFAIDYTKLPSGNNRNLDLRREFRERLDATAIAPTSILSGMFLELLVEQAPIVLTRVRRVLYFRDGDQPLDFTSMDDVAAFTARSALDPQTPRFLRIAGDRKTARELVEVASEATGKSFGLIRGGNLGTLDFMIRVAKFAAPGKGQVYPPWQGMQYLRDMFDGRGFLEPLDNDRYGRTRWKSVLDVLQHS